jgi:hypothetical protein
VKSKLNTQRGCGQRFLPLLHIRQYCLSPLSEDVTKEDRGRDGGTNFILRIKEQETCLTVQEHDDNDDEVKMSSQAVMYSKQAGIYPRLCPLKGQ